MIIPEDVRKGLEILRTKMATLIGTEALVIADLGKMNPRVTAYLPKDWEVKQFAVIISSIVEIGIKNPKTESVEIDIKSTDDYIKENPDNLKEVNTIRDEYIELYMNIDGAI